MEHKASTKIAENKGRTTLKAETTLRRHLLAHCENSNRPRGRDTLEMLGHHRCSEDNEKEINGGETFVLEEQMRRSHIKQSTQKSLIKVSKILRSIMCLAVKRECSGTENDLDQYGPRLGKLVCLCS